MMIHRLLFLILITTAVHMQVVPRSPTVHESKRLAAAPEASHHPITSVTTHFQHGGKRQAFRPCSKRVETALQYRAIHDFEHHEH